LFIRGGEDGTAIWPFGSWLSILPELRYDQLLEETMPLLMDCVIPVNAWQREIGARNGVPTVQPPVQKTVEDAGPWESAIKEITKYQHLGDDWDGLGAKAPSRELLDSAIGLGYLFYQKGVPPPSRVVPGLEGEVIFEWQEPDGTYTDVEIVRPFFAEVIYIEPGKPAKHWTLPTA
jgi:hypothetical protein